MVVILLATIALVAVSWIYTPCLARIISEPTASRTNRATSEPEASRIEQATTPTEAPVSDTAGSVPEHGPS